MTEPSPFTMSISWSTAQLSHMHEQADEIKDRVIPYLTLLEAGGRKIPANERKCLIQNLPYQSFSSISLYALQMKIFRSTDGSGDAYSFGLALRCGGTLARPGSYDEVFDSLSPRRLEMLEKLPEWVAQELGEYTADDTPQTLYLQRIVEIRHLDYHIRKGLSKHAGLSSILVTPIKTAPSAVLGNFKGQSSFVFSNQAYQVAYGQLGPGRWEVSITWAPGVPLEPEAFIKAQAASGYGEHGIWLLTHRGHSPIENGDISQDTIGNLKETAPSVLTQIAACMEHASPNFDSHWIARIEEKLETLARHPNKPIHTCVHKFHKDDPVSYTFIYAKMKSDNMFMANFIPFKKQPSIPTVSFTQAQDMASHLTRVLNDLEKDGLVKLEYLDFKDEPMPAALWSIVQSSYYHKAVEKQKGLSGMVESPAKMKIAPVGEASKAAKPSPYIFRTDFPEALTPKALFSQFIHSKDQKQSMLHSLQKMLDARLCHISQLSKRQPTRVGALDDGSRFFESNLVMRRAKKQAALDACLAGGRPPLFDIPPGTMREEELKEWFMVITPAGFRPEAPFSGLIVQYSSIGRYIATGGVSTLALDFPRGGRRQFQEQLKSLASRLSEQGPGTVFIRGESLADDPWHIHEIMDRFPGIAVATLPKLKTKVLSNGVNLDLAPGIVRTAELSEAFYVMLSTALPPQIKKKIKQPWTRHSYNVWRINTRHAVDTAERKRILRHFVITNLVQLHQTPNQAAIGEHVVMRLLRQLDSRIRVWTKLVTLPKEDPEVTDARNALRKLAIHLKHEVGPDQYVTERAAIDEMIQLFLKQSASEAERLLSQSFAFQSLKHYANGMEADGTFLLPLGIFT